jgi:hypothetical protein
VIPKGDLPGENAPGADWVGVAGVIAWLVAVIVSASSLRGPEAIALRVRQLLPLAAVAFAVVGYYTFDPYYAPTHRRFSDYASGGAKLWVAFVIAAAVATVIVSSRRARLGLVATLVVLVLCIPTAFLGAGH